MTGWIWSSILATIRLVSMLSSFVKKKRCIRLSRKEYFYYIIYAFKQVYLAGGGTLSFSIAVQQSQSQLTFTMSSSRFVFCVQAVISWPLLLLLWGLLLSVDLANYISTVYKQILKQHRGCFPTLTHYDSEIVTKEHHQLKFKLMTPTLLPEPIPVSQQAY